VNPAAGPFAIGALLLALGGCSKVGAPADTANALRGVGAPVGPGLVRLAALVEAAVGVYALAVGDRLAGVLVMVSYLGFSAFVAVALLEKAPIATCGCFGKADTPPSLVHLACNLGFAAAALAVIVDPGVAIADVVRSQPLAGVPFLLFVVTGVALTFLALTALPRTMALARARQS
jgi:hypothetical protein